MLKNFLPRFYSDNVEMQAIINTEQIEFDLVTKQIRNTFDDVFPINATINGIVNWEILFGIVPNPQTETLQFRRQRLLNRLSNTIPFTETVLQNRLNIIIGEGNWTYEIDYNNYTLRIISLQQGDSWQNELMLTLESILPVNIKWTIELYYQTWQALYDNGLTWQDIYTTYGTWKVVKEGQSNE